MIAVVAKTILPQHHKEAARLSEWFSKRLPSGDIVDIRVLEGGPMRFSSAFIPRGKADEWRCSDPISDIPRHLSGMPWWDLFRVLGDGNVHTFLILVEEAGDAADE